MINILKNKKILVVDDMKVNYLALAKILKPYDILLEFEQNPKNALAVAKEFKPNVILLDFEMPEMTGPEVCRVIRQDPDMKDTPVLFITSQTGETELSAAFDSGADDYILKPAREKELVSRLSRSLQTVDLQEKLRTQFEDQTMLTRILSHDINNMLMILQGSVMKLSRVIEDRETPKNKALETIQRITDLIKNVRTLQSLDDQKLVPDLQVVTLMDVFRDCKTTLNDTIHQKEIEILFDCMPEMKIIAEPSALLNSVINNVVSNAIKFSYKKGKILIHAVESGDSIEVKVRDHGMGMNEELRLKLFSKTEKTTRLGTLNEKGTGFGMPIVRKYMQLFGGNIEIKSKSIEEFPNESGTEITLKFKKA